MTEDELLECPFCNGSPAFSFDDGAYYCKDCGCMPYVNDGKTPAEAWNSRVVPAWLRKKIEEMKQTYYCSDVLDKVLSLTPGEKS